MTVPRILVLSPVAPGYSTVGRLFLHEICALYPRGQLACFYVGLQNRTEPPPSDLAQMPLAYGQTRSEAGFARLGKRIARLNKWLFWVYIYRTDVHSLIAQAVEFGEQFGADMVLGIMHNSTFIGMVKPVASSLKVPYVTLVWDPPEYKLQGLNKLEFNCLLHKFNETMRASNRCGVASTSMQEEYQARFQVRSEVLIYSPHPPLWRTRASTPKSDMFVIGFAGNLYAKREWDTLLAALTSVDWRIEGRPVAIRLISHGVELKAQKPVHIEYFGWRSISETVQLLSETDVAYLPYWFDSKYSEAVRLCFPNKLPTYLAAGVPVLYHGPEDSSPTRFLREYPAGVCCHSLDEAAIIEALRDALQYGCQDGFMQARQRALKEEFNPHIFRRRFAWLMGVEENDLLPVSSKTPLSGCRR